MTISKVTDLQHFSSCLATVNNKQQVCTNLYRYVDFTKGAFLDSVVVTGSYRVSDPDPYPDPDSHGSALI